MMCQRLDCAYVHPPLMKMMADNQRKGKKGGFPFVHKKPEGVNPPFDANAN